MEGIQATVEQACREFSDPSTSGRAEQVLLQFRRSGQPLQACQYILEHSSSVDARFQAACTLREAAVREWAALSREDADRLRAYLLQYVVRHAAEPALAVVRAALLASLALVLKRGWLEESAEGHARFMQDVQQTVSAAGSAAAQRVGVELLAAVVTEFSLATASPLGLAWDYHEQCCKDLQAHFLQGFFLHGVALARDAAASGAAAAGRDEGLCAACMALLSAILGWDFRRGVMSSTMAGVRRGASDTVSVTPGVSWSRTLLPEATTAWLVALLPQLVGRATPLAAASRQLLVALCSLTGDVLPKVDTDGLVAGYLRQMLRGVLPWICPADAVVKQAQAGSEEQLMDACKALSALAASHKLSALDDATRELMGPSAAAAAAATAAASSSSATPGGFVQMLEALTLALVRAGGASAEEAGNWLFECTDMLLEAWVLLTRVDASLSIVKASSLLVSTPRGALPPGAVEAAAAIFCALVDAALADAAAGARDDTEGADEAGAASSLEEGMCRAASLARSAPVVTFAHVAHRLMDRQQALHACLTQGQDPSEVLEQLVWLLGMAAHCLADSGAGETALPPLAVLMAAERGGPEGAAIEQLCRLLVEFPALVLQPAWRPVLSPRLMEAAAEAAARWADTYLMPEEDSDWAAGGLLTAYGANSPAAHAVLGALVGVANACLTAFPGEAQLHTQVITGLLPVLVRRQAICVRLVQLGSWQELVGAFASRQPVLTLQLSHKLHRSLAQALAGAAAGCPDAASTQQYTSQLLHSTAEQVVSLAHAPNLQSALAAQAGVGVQLCCLLDTLRGATRATTTRSQPALFATAERLLGPLLLLQRAFSGNSAVVSLLLKLAADLVENHISYLPPAQADVLLQWVLRLLQQHSAGRGGAAQPPPAASQALRDAQLAEQARELRALLSLLTHVTQRDLVDFGSPTEAQQAGTSQPPAPQFDVAQLVLLGLHILLPLMSLELLKFPKLCRLYFTLLTYMLEIYPEQFVSLEAAHFAALMQSLEFGLLHTDTTVLTCALEGLAGLGKFQYQAQQTGSAGLASRHPGGSAAGGEGVVPHFTRLLLRRLLLEDSAVDIVELAGDALLPLLLCDATTYQQMGAQLLQGQGAVATARLTTALVSLLQAGGVTQDLTRPNRRRFRQNLCQMVADVRGLIRVR